MSILRLESQGGGGGTQLGWQVCRGAQGLSHMLQGRAQLIAEVEHPLLTLQCVPSAEPCWDLAEEGTSLFTVSSLVESRSREPTRSKFLC